MHNSTLGGSLEINRSLLLYKQSSYHTTIMKSAAIDY